MSNYIKHVTEVSSGATAGFGTAFFTPVAGADVIVQGPDDDFVIVPPVGVAGVYSAFGGYMVIKLLRLKAGEALVFGQSVAIDGTGADFRTAVLADLSNPEDVFAGIVVDEAVASGEEFVCLAKGIHPAVDFGAGAAAAGEVLTVSTTAGLLTGDDDANTLFHLVQVGVVLTAGDDVGTSDIRAMCYINSPLA